MIRRLLTCWDNEKIANKLRASFDVLFLLIALIIGTWLFSLHLANEARETINTSAAIERTVLNMDRLLEKARRLLNDFFLQYGRIGLHEAHVQFAQPSVRLMSEAIAASSELKTIIQQIPADERLLQEDIDLNLYLATSKRFADTSIEAIELVSRLAAPETGLEATIAQLLAALKRETKDSPPLRDLCGDLQNSYQEYRISRQRPAMQSAFNVLFRLQQLSVPPSVTSVSQKKIAVLLNQLKQTGEEILATDLAIKNKLNDFNLQTSTSQPIAQKLVTKAKAIVERAQANIILALRLSSILLATLVIAAIASSLLISRFVARNITSRILELTQAASRLEKGQLESTAAEQPHDELGQLGRAFNAMSGRIQELVQNLEQKVEQRTLELAESEQRFRYIANELPTVAIIGFDANRQVFFWNQTSERLYGATSQDAVGQPIESLIAADHQQEPLRNALRQWIEEDVAIPACERTFRQSDGAEVQVYVSFFALTNTRGVKEMYSIHIDLTDLKEAQRESAVKESLYRNLFNHTSSGVGVLEAIDDGQDFLVRDMNKAAEEIERRPSHEAIGKRLTEIFPGVEPTGILAELRQVWQTGLPKHLPPMLYQYTKQHRWQQGHIYKIPSGEVVIVYDDITQLHEAELERAAMEAKLQRAQKMEAIGLLAGGVAHDLNNILSGIVSYPELILMQLPPDSKLRKSVLAIQASGQRAAAVVADLLTVARGISSERQLCQINSLVREHLASPEHQALLSLHPGVCCALRLDDNAWPMACSPVHFKKSLMNLVTNAAEAIDRAGRITVRTRNEELDQVAARAPGVAPGRYVVLEVADTGSGIAATDIDHIFEPFYTKKVMGRSGTGLGLAVVWNTIQDHKGGITVSSSNQGTVFTLFFPAAEDASPSRQQQEAAGPHHGAGQSILIVDDDPQLRDIAAQMLKVLNYEVVTAASGEEAIAYLREHKVDLVLLDMLMSPGMNGRQTYEQIIPLHPGQKALIASGFSEDEEVQRAIALGVSGYLQKPYGVATLAKALESIFQS